MRQEVETKPLNKKNLQLFGLTFITIAINITHQQQRQYLIIN